MPASTAAAMGNTGWISTRNRQTMHGNRAFRVVRAISRAYNGRLGALVSRSGFGRKEGVPAHLASGTVRVIQ